MRLAGIRVGEAERRQLGRALRAAREAVGLTQARVADKVGCSQGKIQKIEAGYAPITLAELEKLIELYGIPEDRAAALRELATQDLESGKKVARPPRWPALGQLVDLEPVASEIRCLHAERIPGPLQSEHYMLQVMVEAFGEVDVTEVIRSRRRRARILHLENGPRYRVILSESSVRRTLRGRPEIIVDQLEHLLTLMRTCKRLELQILPFEADVLFMDADFRVLHFADDTQRDFAYIECPGGAHTFKAKDDLARFDKHWDALHGVALSAAETEDFLSRLVNSKTT